MPAVADQEVAPTATAPRREKTVCLVPATRFMYRGSEFEFHIYSPSTRFIREMEGVFPQLSHKQKKSLLVVPVIQRCEHDMVGSTPEINKERDDKLDLFIEWARRIVNRITAIGFWADMTDPASGYPVCGPSGSMPYPDVHATQTLTRYDIQNVGCCHILLHPKWKSHIYPTTLFSTAPADILHKVIEEQFQQE